MVSLWIAGGETAVRFSAIPGRTILLPDALTDAWRAGGGARPGGERRCLPALNGGVFIFGWPGDKAVHMLLLLVKSRPLSERSFRSRSWLPTCAGHCCPLSCCPLSLFGVYRGSVAPMGDNGCVNGEYFVLLSKDYKTVQQYFADRNISMQDALKIAEGQPPLSHNSFSMLCNSRGPCRRVLAFAPFMPLALGTVCAA